MKRIVPRRLRSSKRSASGVAKLSAFHRKTFLVRPVVSICSMRVIRRMLLTNCIVVLSFITDALALELLHQVGNRVKREDAQRQRLLDLACSRRPTLKYCIRETNIRRFPLPFGISPLSLGKSTGNDAKFAIPGIGTLGIGDVVSQIAKFTPDLTLGGATSSDGSSTADEKRTVGFDEDSDLGGAAQKSRSNTLSIAGLGTFDLDKTDSKGSGLSKLANSLFSLSPFRSDNYGLARAVSVTDSPSATNYVLPNYQYFLDAERPRTEDVRTMTVDDHRESPSLSTDANGNDAVDRPPNENAPTNPFDIIKERPDLLSSSYEKESRDASAESAQPTASDGDKESFTGNDQPSFSSASLISQTQYVPLASLGLKPSEIQSLCERFAPTAAKHCYVPKVELVYLDKCRGYWADCSQFIAQRRPLEAAANAVNSQVGVTYFNAGVNGIPFYPLNEEGSTNVGHNGKASFGSWGGGYSDDIAIRDFYTQRSESGGNWYEGIYGFKSGWSVPIARQFGVEGGGGTQVYVPLKEEELGRGMQVANGYHVGPYIGVGESVGVDWLNGVVRSQQGFASPFLGMTGNAGTSIAFPSVGILFRGLGLGNTPAQNSPPTGPAEVVPAFGSSSSSAQTLPT